MNRLVRGDNPSVGFTEHPCADCATLVVAVNYAPEPVVCRLETDGHITRLWGDGSVRDGTLALGANDGVVMEVWA